MVVRRFCSKTPTQSRGFVQVGNNNNNNNNRQTESDWRTGCAHLHAIIIQCPMK